MGHFLLTFNEFLFHSKAYTLIEIQTEYWKLQTPEWVFLLDSPDGCVLAAVKEEEVKRTIVKFDQHTQNEMHTAWNSCV